MAEAGTRPSPHGHLQRTLWRIDPGLLQRAVAASAHDAHAEDGMARVGERIRALDPARGVPRVVAEHRVDRVGDRRVDRHVGAQLVHRQPLHQVGRPVRLHIQQQGVVQLGDEEIEQILALRGQQSGVNRGPGRDPVDVVGDQPLQERPGVRAGNRQHATIFQPYRTRLIRHGSPSRSHTGVT